MDHHSLFILIAIAIAYIFDFTNGVHDAANTIAMIVVNRVLTPRQAVLWAAFFNFIAFLFFNLMVAKTLGTGLIDSNIINTKLIFSALIAAICWNLVSWYFGLPSSSSYALIGGLTGAAIVQGGVGTLQWTGFIKVAAGICVVPTIGMLVSLITTYIFTKLFKPNASVFKWLQLIASALLSLTHGGNDAQKTMGVITVLLFSASWLQNPSQIPGPTHEKINV